MKRFKIWFAIFILFFSGVCTGLLGGRILMQCRIKHMEKRGPQAMREAVLNKMSKDLGLTSEQQEHISRIMTQMDEQVRKLHEKTDPDMEKLFEQSHAQIRKELNAEQLVKFDEMEKKFKKHRPPFPGPPL
jgi:hypothetical protein